MPSQVTSSFPVSTASFFSQVDQSAAQRKTVQQFQCLIFVKEIKKVKRIKTERLYSQHKSKAKETKWVFKSDLMFLIKY